MPIVRRQFVYAVVIASLTALTYARGNLKELNVPLKFTPQENAAITGSSVDLIADKATATTPSPTRLGVVKKRVFTTLTSPATGVGNMTYHGGSVQHAQKIYTIFWFPSGTSLPAGYQSTINQFVQDLNGSAYYAIASQYTDSAGPVSSAVLFGGTWVDTTNPIPSSFTTNQDTSTLLAEVNRAKNANGWASDANSFFLVYTPTNVTSNSICGYHWFDSNITFGVILYPVTGCKQASPWPNGELVDAAISVSSHEIMETVTDPFTNAWFYVDVTGEIGDLCNLSFGLRDASGSNIVLNGHRYVIQQEWSNADAGCVMSYNGSGGSCGNSGAQSALASAENSPEALTSAAIRPPPFITSLPKDGVWRRTARKNGEAWTYTFNIDEDKERTKLSALGQSADMMFSSRRIDADLLRDVADGSQRAGSQRVKRFSAESTFTEQRTTDLPSSNSFGHAVTTTIKRGDLTLQPPQIGKPLRQWPLDEADNLRFDGAADASGISGEPAAHATSVIAAGTKPFVSNLGAPVKLDGVLTSFDTGVEDAAAAGEISSVRVFLKLTHPRLDQVKVVLANQAHKLVLWDGIEGGIRNDSSLILDRMLTEELKEASSLDPWRLYISSQPSSDSGVLEEAWVTTTIVPRPLAASAIIGALATLDIAAVRAYMRTAPSGGGTEVDPPTVGQSVYFHGDYQVTGSGSSVNVTQRALIDGSVFCSGSAAGSPGFSYTVSCGPWTAASGTHTLQWDLDYTNSVSETNENNNSVVKTFTASGLDIAASRAYMMTAPSGGGTEVDPPTVGQSVYFHGDYQVTGSGSSVNVTQRALIDGSVFCSGSAVGSPGFSYTVSCGPWTATSGTHTLQWDLDYTNSVSETNENNNSVAKTFTASGLDIAAVRAYMRTAPSGGGTEVDPPTVGQSVYLHGDYQVTGSGGSVNVTQRALIDGSLFCSGSAAGTPGFSYTVSCGPWTATAGSHTLRWDLDYTNSVSETNENNNSVSKTFTPSGGAIDIVAQRAYLRTASAGGGSEVSQPTVGQALYLHADYQVTGSGSAVNVTERALLDGNVLCACSNNAVPGNSYIAWCSQAWTATSGSHTLQWDFDYGSSVSETNEGNNSTSKAFSTGDSPPATSITSPSNGATVSGTVSVNATASDDVAVTSLEIDIDGSTKSTTNASSLTYSWNTTQFSNGQHTIVSKAGDGAGHFTTSSQVTVTVSNIACSSFTISPSSATRTSAAGSQPVTLTGVPAGCQGGSWSTTGNGSWLTVSPANGSGPGTVTVSWGQNPSSSQRLGTVVIANNNFAVTQSGVGQVLPHIVRTDIDADGRSDISIFRPLLGDWYFRRSSNGQTTYIPNWGPQATDIPVPGDYDGDHIVDAAVFRPIEGNWYIRQSSTGTLLLIAQWGLGANDKPVAGDYDGDGKTDAAIFRPLTGEWFIHRSSDGGTIYVPNYGPGANDIPVPGDYDGDGKTDIAIFRPITGDWFIRQSSNGVTMYVPNFGPLQNDKPVPADYDGDGKTDIAIFRPIAGDWYILRSSDGGVTYIPNYGPLLNDIPVPADYDGDGKADIAIYRPGVGDWYIRQSTNGITLYVANYGPVANDKPLPAYQN